VTHEELELLADIRDSTTLFDVILRFETSEWLESSIKCDFAIFSLDLAFHNLLSSNTLSGVRTSYLT